MLTGSCIYIILVMYVHTIVDKVKPSWKWLCLNRKIIGNCVSQYAWHSVYTSNGIKYASPLHNMPTYNYQVMPLATGFSVCLSVCCLLWCAGGELFTLLEREGVFLEDTARYARVQNQFDTVCVCVWVCVCACVCVLMLCPLYTHAGLDQLPVLDQHN